MPLSKEAKYQIIQSFLSDNDFYAGYLKNPQEQVRQAGASTAEEITEIHIILAQLQSGKIYAESQTEALKKMAALYEKSTIETLETADSFKHSIRQTLKQINSGYMVVMMMYVLAFLTGIVLVIAAIVLAVNKQQNLLSIIFGSLGTLEILVFFFTKPPLHLQNSRIRHAQLEMGFYSWFLDVYNINSYLTSLNGKTDDATMYARFLEVVDKQLVHTKETLQSLKDFTTSTASEV